MAKLPPLESVSVQVATIRPATGRDFLGVKPNETLYRVDDPMSLHFGRSFVIEYEETDEVTF
jgi:hypothetical protein